MPTSLIQDVQRTTFKPEWVAPASLKLVAYNAAREPKRYAGSDAGSAMAVSAVVWHLRVEQKSRPHAGICMVARCVV